MIDAEPLGHDSVGVATVTVSSERLDFQEAMAFVSAILEAV